MTIESPCAAATIAGLAIALTTLCPPLEAQAPSLVGTWHPEVYVMKDGTRRTVDGLMFFSPTHWTALFFIVEEGEIERGAGEGGAYSLEGTRLVLRHQYHLSAGRALPHVPRTDPLRMDARSPAEATEEVCVIAFEAGRLRIDFPSGNHMVFRRAADSAAAIR
ncbi:MAG: hypothetical protein KJ066_08415 [Acidobacteria bacterium]|nr:hypothetical protein [Acidobacteriota bacterium]